MRLADLELEDSNSVYVMTKATKLMGVPSHVLLPHKSTQGGETFVIEIPMTFVPIDLAAYAPKAELLRNPDLMRQLNNGVLILMSSEDAEHALDNDTAMHEIDRLQAVRQAKLVHTPNHVEDDMAFRAMHPDAQVPRGAPGELNVETANVQTPVVDIMENKDYSDDDRLVMLRNLLDIMTDVDKRYVRSKTRDARILAIVG
jgi:hypothetical protein